MSSKAADEDFTCDKAGAHDGSDLIDRKLWLSRINCIVFRYTKQATIVQSSHPKFRVSLDRTHIRRRVEIVAQSTNAHVTDKMAHP